MEHRKQLPGRGQAGGDQQVLQFCDSAHGYGGRWDADEGRDSGACTCETPPFPLTRRDLGVILLTSSLGDRSRRELTSAQFHNLALRLRCSTAEDPQQPLSHRNLMAAGLDQELANRIMQLLSQRELAESYLRTGARQGCYPIVWGSPLYPSLLRKRLGNQAPCVLWGRGDSRALCRHSVALVGSRDLAPCNQSFASQIGREAAVQGWALISGNARGADRAAQDACREAGGWVISVLSDEVVDKPLHENLLYLSEDGYQAPFSKLRALSRNRIIHAMGEMVFVAQSSVGKGGTWDGTTKNLRSGWSPVFCFDDRSDAVSQLMCRGAKPVTDMQLRNFRKLLAQTEDMC